MPEEFNPVATGGDRSPKSKLSRAEQARINGAKSNGPKTPPGEGVSCLKVYLESLTRTRCNLYSTLDHPCGSHPHTEPTQIPNTHNYIDPESEPRPNPVGLRANPAV